MGTKQSMKDALKASVNSEMSSSAAKAKSFDQRFAAAEAITATHEAPALNVAPAVVLTPMALTPAATSKVVRDTFSMPEDDFVLLEKLRSRARRMDIDTNKSELVRAGLRLLADLDDSKLEQMVKSVEKLKPGPRAKA